MNEKYEAASNAEASNSKETGWESVAAMADEFQGGKTTETKTAKAEKLNADNNVYREIAKNALKNWNGLSDEEASEKVAGVSVEELENQVYAEDSIKAAIDGISNVLNKKGKISVKMGEDGILRKTDEKIVAEWNEQEELLDSILSGDKQDASFTELGNQIQHMLEARHDIEDDYFEEDFVLDVLDNIHTDWIEHNSKKFFDEKRVDKQYQFMPLDLIGFKEAMADNIFLEPILEAAGVNIPDDITLEQAYNDKRNRFARNWKLEEAVIKDGAEPDDGYSSRSGLAQTMFSSNFPQNKVPENLRNVYDALGDEATAGRVINQVGQKSEDIVFSY
ncbi:hypothetical protein IJG78_03660 [Candidatus Saccharibacteria bacterium]|nr:hypothetical protein [Candidatus Saccharibacteria bacterium]